MKRGRATHYRGYSCNLTTPFKRFCVLSSFIIIGSHCLFLTTTMAWMIHRSFDRLASRLPSLPSFFLRRSVSSISSTSLHSYQSFLNENHDKILVSYFTDIEGDKFYFDRYVDNSKILKWISNERRGGKSKSELSMYSAKEFNLPYERRVEFCHPNSILIFGGDLWDKGGFDLYVARQLLDLKRRYPKRVFWVLGNRDINKLRMTQELGLPTSIATTSSVAARVPYHPGLTWFRGSGRVGDPDGTLPSMIPGERLKWILGNTMGSPDAFDHRKQELFWETTGCREENSRCINREKVDNVISDEDVVRSYQESCHPRGEMGRFLAEGLLAVKVGPILCVHGSLPLTKDVMTEAKQDQSIWDDMTFCMPWINKTHHDYANDHHYSTASDFGVKTIEDWLEVLNNFSADNIEAWKHHTEQLETEYKKERQGEYDNFTDRQKEESKNSIWAYRAGYGNGPSYSGIYFSDLVQYGMGMIPGGKKNPTVVYNSFTPEGMPTSFLQTVEKRGDIRDNNPGIGSQESSESDVARCTREFLEQSTIRLILTGHKPQGDMPSPIRVGQSSWIICADTSYSGDTKWFHDDRNVTTPEKMERRRKLQEERRSNLGRGNSISFRGETAVSEVLVELSNGATTLESILYHGVLSDGTKYESIDLLGADDADSDDNDKPWTKSFDSVGQVAPECMVPNPLNSPHEGRWWTKGICRDGSRLYYAGEGYDVWNYIVPPDTKDGSKKELDKSK